MVTACFVRNMNKSSSCANIALIKYWGKRDEVLMLPTKSSLSVTLDALKTITHAEFSDADRFIINGVEASGEVLIKFSKFIDQFRKKFGITQNFFIESFNSFPTAAGLASSASGFAALAMALNDLCLLNLDKKELSMLARLGSGSASRSVYGGFVIWNKGCKADGTDSFAEQIFTSDHWPELRVIIVVVQAAKKMISSSRAMQISVNTSPNYIDWVKRSELRMQPMIEAIKRKDLDALGVLAEADCLEMHETMKCSVPSINYLNEKTMSIVELVKSLRNSGLQCYFTIDAGPNVKIITTESNQEHILQHLKNIEGVEQVIVSKIA